MGFLTPHPDQWIGAPLIDRTEAAVTAPLVYGPLYCGTFDTLAFSFAFNGGAASPLTVTLDFFPTADLTSVNLNRRVWLSTANTPIVDVVPVGGPYARFTLTGWTGSRSMKSLVVPRRGYSPAARLHDGSPLARAAGLTAVAGGNVAIPLSPVMAGPATMTVRTDGIAWTAYVQELNTVGVVSRVAMLTGTEAGGVSRVTIATVAFFLPPAQCQFVWINNDAVLRTLDGAVVAGR